MALITIKQGMSVALKYGTDPTQDMTSWVCQVVVKTRASGKSGAAVISKTLAARTVDDLYWVGALTPAETVALAPGRYWVMAELDNAGTSENLEIHDQMEVGLQGVS
jgi:hypothetical protein